MGDFLVFVIIVFAAFWGSMFLARRLRPPAAPRDTALAGTAERRLRESLDLLESRVVALEEESEFLKKLLEPRSSAEQLPPADHET